MSRLEPQKPLSAAARMRATQKVSSWFGERQWKVFPFQKQAWQAYLDGHSGLIHATTGTGKTLAAWLGPVIEAVAESERTVSAIGDGPTRVLWITPLRALAVDTLHSLRQPLLDLQIGWSVESRTGDTSAAERQRQRKRLPTVLVTTPESLSLMLTRSDAAEQFRDLRAVICDEWHELLSTKRGVQVELALARLRRWRPDLRTWGLSATLGNLDEALQVLIGSQLVKSIVIGPEDQFVRNTTSIPQTLPQQSEPVGVSPELIAGESGLDGATGQSGGVSPGSGARQSGVSPEASPSAIRSPSRKSGRRRGGGVSPESGAPEQDAVSPETSLETIQSGVSPNLPSPEPIRGQSADDGGISQPGGVSPGPGARQSGVSPETIQSGVSPNLLSPEPIRGQSADDGETSQPGGVSPGPGARQSGVSLETILSLETIQSGVSPNLLSPEPIRGQSADDGGTSQPRGVSPGPGGRQSGVSPETSPETSQSGVSPGGIGPTAMIVQAAAKKRVVVDALIPSRIDRFPWAGHMGLNQLSEVLACVESARTTLVFTNTRSQTEAWYHAILKARNDWAGVIALHHGSLEQQTRSWVEDGLRDGRLKCVVCTSSLDLGVDFSPVDRVLQVGSPRGVARLLQRAGRSGHQPGAVSRVTCVPTHALELIEAAAARDAIEAGHLEGRLPHKAPIDVLCQHLVTIGTGEGFESESLFQEVRCTYSYADLPRSAWDWALNFAARGGESLKAYPDFHRLHEQQGRFVVSSPKVARQHRMSIGTITSDASLVVQYLNGPALGTIEESFLAKLNPGDCFLFSGRTVELVHVHDMKVWVRKAPASAKATIPRWMGGRLPLSTELATAVRLRLQEAHHGEFRGPELQAVRPLLNLQAEWSAIPLPDELLIEQIKTREGFHLLMYPFAGRLVHEGLAALFAWRFAQRQAMTFTMSVNDYGFELLSATEAPLDQALASGLLDEGTLIADLEKCLNAAEMGKRQFREIARVAGLIFQGYPGQQRTAKQLQASSGLLYDVFSNYDPENLLLRQSRTEVLERQLEHTRLVTTLKCLQIAKVVRRSPQRLTPLAFPLIVARLRERLSSEKLSDRIARMTLQLEKAAGT